ncbi:hypothetical protein DM02DRAFT_671655 [Periconia macrospinosa]|uniref:Uncharacterized protein n=1 Tax=Periconia macrospinosa TaxID=97972 RepID=A0A2V1DRH3_9PLEO|nr:hypothetical protein DM02DRAFT_671655 [Periconia macrospinosa]
MADFNNFIRKDVDAESSASNETKITNKAATNDTISSSSKDTSPADHGSQEVAKLKMKIASMEHAVKLFDERYRNSTKNYHDARRAAREKEHLEEVIRGQEFKLRIKDEIWNTKFQSIKAYVDDLHALVKSTKETADENAIKKLEANHAQAMQAMTADHERKTQAMIAEHNRKITALSQEYQSQLQKQREEDQKKMKQVHSNYVSDLKTRNHAFEQSLKQLRQQNQGKDFYITRLSEQLCRNDEILQPPAAVSVQSPNLNLTPNPPRNLTLETSHSPARVPMNTPQLYNLDFDQYNQATAQAPNPWIHQAIPNTLKRQHSHNELQAPSHTPVRQRTESYLPFDESPQFLHLGTPFDTQQYPNNFSM